MSLNEYLISLGFSEIDAYDIAIRLDLKLPLSDIANYYVNQYFSLCFN